MNTQPAPSSSDNSDRTGRFAALRNLGRGIAATSAVALLGVGTMSAADASAAGVAHGVRYSVTAEHQSPTATDLPSTSRQLVVRDGKVRRL